MKWMIPLWIAEALFVALFIVAGHPISTKKGFGFKMAACALYIVNVAAAFSLSQKTAFGVTVALGILGGFLGDVFLAADPFIRDRHNTKLSFTFVMLGGIFFLAGHIAYIISFLHLLFDADAFRFLPFAGIWGGTLLFFALLLKITDIHAGKYTFPVALYATGLSCMFSLGICAALFAAHGMFRYLLLAAPVLFVLSDITLAIKTADPKRFGSLGFRALCMTSYFLAQMLFGTAILLQS